MTKTEATPLDNPYWAYSRAKAEMEGLLQAQHELPWTIVRPSHTYRTKMPTPLGGEVSRLLRGKPAVVHGDGITHADLDLSAFSGSWFRLVVTAMDGKRAWAQPEYLGSNT